MHTHRFLRSTWATVLIGSFSALATAGSIPPPDYAEGYSAELPCVDRIGRCFDAKIGGRPVTVIQDLNTYRKIQALMPEGSGRFRNVFWQVTDALDGAAALSVETTPNAFGLKQVGRPEQGAEVIVYAIAGQNLESSTQTAAREDVRIDGRNALTEEDLLEQDDLPAGPYVMAIKFKGQLNWDRKWVFFRVE